MVENVWSNVHVSIRSIRVNAVETPMGRAAKADEISPCFVFPATQDSMFVTGQIIHANGGEYFG